MTTEQAARELGVTPIRVRQLCIAGEIRATKFGRSWMIEQAALDEYKAKPRQKPGPKPKEQTP